MFNPPATTLAPLTGRDFVTEVLAVAASQLGVVEVPRNSNRGPQVDEYLHAAGEPSGVPWCSSFTFWCVLQACRKLGIPLSEVPFPRTGYVPAVAAWAEGNKILYAPNKAQAQTGDAFIMVVGGHYRHIGFVASVSGGQFSTIEGNASPTPSKEGYGVFRRTRPLNGGYVFVRFREVLRDRVNLPTPDSYDLMVGSEKLATMQVLKGTAWCPVRAFADHFGMQVGWDNDSQTLSLNGRRMNHDISMREEEGGLKAYAPIRELAAASGLIVQVTASPKEVRLVWPQDYKASAAEIVNNNPPIVVPPSR